MPGMYGRKDYDLAGFCCGIVDRKKIIDGKKIRVGDVLVGIASSGFHSNGFSLVRKVFSRNEIKRDLKNILRPTKLYVKPVLDLLDKFGIRGIAHITGGGFFENIPRILPAGLSAEIRAGSWRVPELFGKLMRKGDISAKEMFRTFNMGIGMVLVLKKTEADKVIERLKKKHRLKSWVIGEVIKGRGRVKITTI